MLFAKKLKYLKLFHFCLFNGLKLIILFGYSCRRFKFSMFKNAIYSMFNKFSSVWLSYWRNGKLILIIIFNKGKGSDYSNISDFYMYNYKHYATVIFPKFESIINQLKTTSICLIIFLRFTKTFNHECSDSMKKKSQGLLCMVFLLMASASHLDLVVITF